MKQIFRYVVLRHTGVTESHFDLMFETSPDSVLATWRSSTWPVTRDSILTPLAEHRRVYLEYEGPLSESRGSVSRVSEGTHQIIEDRPDHLILALDNGTQLELPRLAK
jgi:hypothetical protein